MEGEDTGSDAQLLGATMVPMVQAPPVPCAPPFLQEPLSLHDVFSPQKGGTKKNKKRPSTGQEERDEEKKKKDKRSKLPVVVHRQDVDLGGLHNGRCFLLDGVLSPSECTHFIRAAKSAASNDKAGGWEGLERLFDTKYRSGDRMLLMDAPLADLLWNRIKPGLNRWDVLRVRPIGFGNEGTWRPYRLNECLKLVRYKPGDHFSGHVDGPWVPRLDESSIYTVVIYLNDDFTGGGTIFRSESTRELLWKVTPQAGTAVIFNHDTYHEAEPVLEGYKYILRTEMMFQRVDTGAMVAKDDYLTKPTYRKLIKVYAQSDDASDEGNNEVFVKKYLEAIQLQRDEQRSLGADKQSLEAELELPYELYMRIFGLLSPKDVGRLQLVSKLWYDLAQDGVLWKRFYLAQWPDGALPEEEESNAEIENWYGHWKTRLRFERRSCPVVVAIDYGSHTVKLMQTTHEPPAAGDSVKSSTMVKSLFARISGMRSWHYRAPDRYIFGDTALKQPSSSQCRLVEGGRFVRKHSSQIADLTFWCLGKELQLPFPTIPAAIVVSRPPTWTSDDVQLLTSALRGSSIVTLCMEDSGVLVLASYGLKSGIVVDVGHDVLSVSPVHEAKLLRSFVATAQSDMFDPKSAAEVVICVLEKLNQHKNGPKLNRIDLALLRNNVVVTGGLVSKKGWTSAFKRSLARKAQRGSHWLEHRVVKVERARKVQREMDAVKGACMLAEARRDTPLGRLFGQELKPLVQRLLPAWNLPNDDFDDELYG